MKGLTKAEEQIMQYLWSLEKGFVKDIVELFPDPKPAYTTVTTIIRILVKKGFIGFNSYGKVHEYYPLVSKSAYTRQQLRGLVKNYFNGSARKLVSFFTNETDLSLTELEELKEIIDNQIKEKKDE